VVSLASTELRTSRFMQALGEDFISPEVTWCLWHPQNFELRVSCRPVGMILFRPRQSGVFGNDRTLNSALPAADPEPLLLEPVASKIRAQLSIVWRCTSVLNFVYL